MDSGWSKVGRAIGSLLAADAVASLPRRRRLPTSCTFSPRASKARRSTAAPISPAMFRRKDATSSPATPSGRELGRTTTDDDGNFTFTARERVDHYLVAETADGHSGQYIVHASELPDSLPADVPTAGKWFAGCIAGDGSCQRAGRIGGQGERTDRNRDQLAELRKQIRGASPANLRIRRASPLSRYFRRHRFYPRAGRRGLLHEGPADESVGSDQ